MKKRREPQMKHLNPGFKGNDSLFKGANLKIRHKFLLMNFILILLVSISIMVSTLYLVDAEKAYKHKNLLEKTFKM
jgi:hypothetical protein